MEPQADPQDAGAALAFGGDGHAQPDHQRNVTPARQEAHEALKADSNEVRVVGVDVGAEEVGLVRAERVTPLEPLEERGVGDGAAARALERSHLAGNQEQKGVAEPLAEAAGVRKAIPE